jgi:hypothetical protein
MFTKPLLKGFDYISHNLSAVFGKYVRVAKSERLSAFFLSDPSLIFGYAFMLVSN